MDRLNWIWLELLCFFFTIICIYASPITIIANEEGDIFRLPRSILPSRYEIDLIVQPNFTTTARFTGTVRIILRAQQADVDTIVLNSANITYPAESISVTTQEGVSVNIFQSISEDDEVEQITIQLSEALNVTLDYVLTFTNYEGILHDDMQGFYLSSYTDDAGVEQIIATTQFESTYARRAFPSWDEPNFKAVFAISIERPLDYNTLSNTNKNSTATGESSNENLEIDIFEASPLMSTYLVAFIVSKFEAYPGSNNTYGVWSRREALDTAKYSYDIGQPVLIALQDYLNLPYLDSGIGKMDQIAIPDFSAGAMENWGLVTYRETGLLWSDTESTRRNLQSIATVIAHEFTHMWFGNLITLDWWSYTWLNEGFARYFQYVITAQVETDWELDLQFVVEQQQAVFASDALTGALALTSNVSTPSEISNKFASISYNKGASVIRMMRNILGEESFQQGLRSYLLNHQFQNTVPDDLWASLDPFVEPTQIPESLAFADIMRKWTQQAGYPVVTVSLDGDNAVLTQARFLLDPTQTSDFKWDVPITYTISHEPNFGNLTPSHWLLSTEELVIEDILHGETGWVILNVQESGYYRVNYDDTLWDELEAALSGEDFEDIHVLNRAQIVDDSLNLARANIITYTRALGVTSFLSAETEYYPWYSAFNAFSFLRRRIDPDSEIGVFLKQHIQTLMQQLYESVTFDPSEASHVGTLKTALALQWACELDDADCISNSIELFNSYRDNGTSVNPDIRSVVYCTALRNSDSPDNWNFLWDKFTNSTLAAEQTLIITALGCTKDSDLLSEYLTKSITAGSGIRRQDASSVFSAVLAGNREGFDTAFEFLQANFREISVNYGGMNALTSVLNGIADRITTEEQITALQDFVDENRNDLADAAHQAESAIENARANIAWVQSNEEELQTWFSDRYGEEQPGEPDAASPVSLSITLLFGVMVGTILNLH